MSIMYITEYQSLLMASQGVAQIPVEPPIVEQTVAISGSHAESAAFNAATKYIRIESDVACSFAIGAAPVAQVASGTSTDGAALGTQRMGASTPEYKAVTPGHKLSVISTT